MCSTSSSSYRPHDPGHDYYDPGIYLITLVVTGRQPRLSKLGNSATSPSVQPTPTGTIVHEEWDKTATIQASKGRHIETLAQVCMPDHWHGVIQVHARMDRSLGYIIQCFKSACTARWRREVTGYAEPTSSSALIRSISVKNRRAYYATRPLIERPLFDDDYDDTICLSDAHRKRMLAYVADNPRRAIFRRLFPQFMQRQLHIVIDGVEYAAFGNLFLLRWPRKLQVFCHRKAPLGIPYESTPAYREQHDQLIQQVMQGATVVVTPGISPGEQLIKNECLLRHFPLIHLQKEPIGPYWKPEKSRFDACVGGSLLILAPWRLDTMPGYGTIPSTTDYSRFHNLNTLAQHLCQFEGEARIVRNNEA